MTFHVYQDLLGYGAIAWDGNFSREVKESPTLATNRGEERKIGVSANRSQGEATLSQKKEAKWKLKLQTSVINRRLEKILEVISAGSMAVIMRKRDNEWIYVFTLSKEGPTSEIQGVLEQPQASRLLWIGTWASLGKFLKGYPR